MVQASARKKIRSNQQNGMRKLKTFKTLTYTHTHRRRTHPRTQHKPKNDELAERNVLWNPNEATCFLLLWGSSGVRFIGHTKKTFATLHKFALKPFRPGRVQTQTATVDPKKKSRSRTKECLRCCFSSFRRHFSAYTHQYEREAETCIFPSLVLAWSMILHVWLLFIMFFLGRKNTGEKPGKWNV